MSTNVLLLHYSHSSHMFHSVSSYLERYKVKPKACDSISDGSLGDKEARDGLRALDRKLMNHKRNLQPPKVQRHLQSFQKVIADYCFLFLKAYKIDTLNCRVMAHFLAGLFASSYWHGFHRSPHLPFRHY